MEMWGRTSVFPLAGILIVLVGAVHDARSGEATQPVDVQTEDRPVGIFIDKLTASSSTDLHEHSSVIFQFMDQLHRLEKKEKRRPDENELLASMVAPKALTEFADLVEGVLELYKEEPEANPQHRGKDLPKLAVALRELRQRAGVEESAAPKPPVQKAVPGTPAAKYASLDAMATKDVEAFLVRFKALLKAEKYIDVARDELDYSPMGMPPERLAKAMPRIVQKLEGHVKNGAVDLIDEVLVNKAQWKLIDGIAVLVSDSKVKGVIRLAKQKTGEWKCNSISTGSLGELKSLGLDPAQFVAPPPDGKK